MVCRSRHHKAMFCCALKHQNRGKKKSPFMIMSWQTILGAGTTFSAKLAETVQDERQRLNFLNHPELTRFMAFCALRETYSQDEKVLPDALQHLVTDFQFALRNGIDVRFGGQIICLRLCCLSTKGDWPWLIEAGNLTRHFRRAAKKDKSDRENSGLCHFCLAGMEQVPCSDASSSALWIKTTQSAAALVPWDDPSPLLGLPADPHHKNMLFRPDLFHNWHLGMGQCFVASSIVILSKLSVASSIPARFEDLSTLWRQWCRSQPLSSILVFKCFHLPC